jgi:hypothetical protein
LEVGSVDFAHQLHIVALDDKILNLADIREKHNPHCGTVQSLADSKSFWVAEENAASAKTPYESI